jgi:DNA-binding CsgD family transcriptional regulator
MTTVKMQNTLDEILAKLIAIEKAVNMSNGKVPKSSADAVLREKLDRLTIKRHAVLTATLGDVSYQDIAKIMGCDVTTVKLHLKAAMQLLGIETRSSLLVQHKDILSFIPDREYESRYGVSKKWWLEQKQPLMDVLRSIKPTSNQHTGQSHESN